MDATTTTFSKQGCACIFLCIVDSTNPATLRRTFKTPEKEDESYFLRTFQHAEGA
jgi:hypothetical protein